MGIKIKVCGLTKPSDVSICAMFDVNYVGLVFHKNSKRHLSFASAKQISSLVPKGIVIVGLTVDPLDRELDELLTEVPLDAIQLHGSETPVRVRSIRENFGLPIIKSISISQKTDLALIEEYYGYADQLLIDAKRPTSSLIPGGNGVTFDWSLISEFNWGIPWMLAGGLNSSNIGEAIKVSRANQVDISTGVEVSPGVKDRELIKQLVNAARK